MYAQCNVKRQKVVRDTRVAAENTENFPGLGKIEYKPDVPYNGDESIYYRYYSATERIHGRSLEEWLRPSVYIGRAFPPKDSYPKRPWNDRTQTVDNYKKGIRAAFELCIKLGVKFWSGYDSDLAPIGDIIEETNKNYDQVTELIYDYQQKTGIKPLWIGADFKGVQFKNGAITNPDATVVAYAGHKIKRVLDIAHKLNAESILLNCYQEGFETNLNTDMGRDLKFLAKFFKMIIDYRDKIGFRGQLLLQTHKHQKENKQCYLNNLYRILTFLKHYNIERHYKLNVELHGFDFYMSNTYNCFGSIDIKGALIPSETVLLLKAIVERGGLSTGGMTIYLPHHNGSFDSKDLLESYVNVLDLLGKSLRVAIKLVNDVQINKSIQTKYASFTTGWGTKLLNSDVKLEECYDQLNKYEENKGELNSVRNEHWYCVLYRFIDAPLI